MTKSLKNIYLENADHDFREVDLCALKCVLLATYQGFYNPIFSNQVI